MKKYVYFYHAVGTLWGDVKEAKHGIVKLNDKIDAADKYAMFSRTIEKELLEEVKKHGWYMKKFENTNLQFLHEVDE